MNISITIFTKKLDQNKKFKQNLETGHETDFAEGLPSSWTKSTVAQL